MPGADQPTSSRRTILVSGGIGAAGLTLGACSGGSGNGSTLAATEVPVGGGKILADAKIVVTQPTAGEFKAFSAVCTHQGCVVSGVTETIDCGCHQSHFALTDGAVVSGPATAPLPAKTVTVDGDSLTIS